MALVGVVVGIEESDLLGEDAVELGEFHRGGNRGHLSEIHYKNMISQ